MAVHTRLSKKDILDLLSVYKIGNLVNFSGIKEGIENTNYKITTTKNSYVITIFEERVNRKHLPFFLNLMLNCYKKRISCPKPVLDKHSNLINNFNEKKIAIFSFLNGRSKKNWSDINCFEVGKILGKFHSVNKSFKKKITNEFSLDFWEKIFKKMSKSKLDSLIPGINKLLKKELDFINLNWPKNLPKGIIHADLFPDNVFFDGARISGILDFYFSCNDLLIYDLAITINAWCFTKGKFNQSFFNQIIKGYQSERILTKKEKNEFNIILRGASLRFLLTRLYDSINKKKHSFVTLKDPVEYYTILIFHIQSQKGFDYFK
ncbi:MAG: homoserine kinase [Rickettsiales bacterium]|nr:homoserine kinase [Rickettsiales bacterium]RPG13801.1 MAG: homoserine kinase [Pelagibacteraceae bacterium TMED195]|tara:strand:- start:6964 stop:7923 length:960 start_codon:yes stop_codon:yes gene_type:complete